MVAVFYFCLLFQPSDVDDGEPLSPLSVAAAAIDSVGVTVPSPLTENGDTPSLPVFGPPAVSGEFNVAALPSESSRSGTDSASESERDSEFGVARPREVDDIPSSRSPPLEVSGPSWFSQFATFAMRPCLGVRGSVPSSLFSSARIRPPASSTSSSSSTDSRCASPDPLTSAPQADGVEPWVDTSVLSPALAVLPVTGPLLRLTFPTALLMPFRMPNRVT